MNPQEKQDAEFVSKDKDRFMTLPGDRRTESFLILEKNIPDKSL